MARSVPRRDGGAFVLSLFGLLPLDVDNPDRLLAEEGIWPASAGELWDGGVWDQGLPKPWGEFLVIGHATAPGDTAVTALPLDIQFAGIQKRINAFGDRYWQPSVSGYVQSNPVPFQSLKIAPERCFGGPGHPTNPRGRGFQASSRLGKHELVALPNFESAANLIRSVDDRPEPVCLGPGDLADPERLRLSGTYDAGWLKNVAPDFPRDIDPRFFCLAPPDQWKNGFFAGDEHFALSGFSKRHPQLAGRLPGFVSRAFVSFAKDPALVFEAQTRLDTVVFMPSLAKAILVWRSVVNCAHPDGKDVASVMIAYEKTSERRDANHYQTVHALRMDPERGAKYAFSEHQLTPVASLDTINARFARRQAARDTEMERRRQAQSLILDDMHKASGLPAQMRIADPDIEPLPDFLPTAEEIASGEFDLADLIDGAEQLMAKSLEDAEAEQARVAPMLAAQQRFAAEPNISNLDAILAQIETESDTEAPRLASVVAELEATKDATNAEEDPAARSALEEVLNQLQGRLLPVADDERLLREARDRFLGDPSAGPAGEARKALDSLPKTFVDPSTRENVPAFEKKPVDKELSLLEMLAMLDSEDVAQQAAKADATGKLAELDRQISATYPALKPSDGRTALDNLLGAIQSKNPDPDPPASIEEAEKRVAQAIEDARAQLDAGAEQTAAGLAMARRMSPEAFFPTEPMPVSVADRFGDFIKEFMAAGHSLAGRDCAGANLAGADFAGMDLRGTMFEQADLSGAQFHGSLCQGTVFTGADLSGADFAGVDLSGANLSAAKAGGANFERSTQRGNTLIKLEAPDSRFAGAILEDCVMLEAEFARANLDGASLLNCIVIKFNAPHIAARNASFERCSFVEATISDARFDNARLKRCVFVNSDCSRFAAPNSMLDGTGFFGATLMPGIDFRDAQIKNSSFRQRVLSGAQFYGAIAFRTDFGEANLSGADFRLAGLFQCILMDANLSGLKAFGANLLAANLRDANLTGASLRQANLYAADLTGATLIASDLQGANWQKTLLAMASDANQ